MARIGAEFEFLAGAGEMAARTRAFDWASTSIGPPSTWPPHPTTRASRRGRTGRSRACRARTRPGAHPPVARPSRASGPRRRHGRPTRYRRWPRPRAARTRRRTMCRAPGALATALRPVTSPPTIGRAAHEVAQRWRSGRACRRGTRTRHRSRGSRCQPKARGTRSRVWLGPCDDYGGTRLRTTRPAIPTSAAGGRTTSTSGSRRLTETKSN